MTRETETGVELRAGQTLAIAGLMQHTRSQQAVSRGSAIFPTWVYSSARSLIRPTRSVACVVTPESSTA